MSSAIFLQALVFWDISQTGFFRATEQNQTILGFEIFLTIFALVYFVYMYQRLIRSL
jgi:heme/copper-type cytochrome/quinol oxidase subunit 4